MKKDKDILNELEKLAPKLSKLKKDQIDEVPNQYFEALPEKIFSRIREAEQNVPAWQTWLGTLFQPKLRLVYAIAAAVVLGLFLLNNPADNSKSLDDQFASLSKDEMSSYVLANLDDFENDWLATNVSLADTEDFMFLDTDNEAIEEYLLEEMADQEFDEIIL